MNDKENNESGKLVDGPSLREGAENRTSAGGTLTARRCYRPYRRTPGAKLVQEDRNIASSTH